MEYFFEDVEMMMISTSFFSGSNSSNLLGVVVDICMYILIRTYKEMKYTTSYGQSGNSAKGTEIQGVVLFHNSAG
jgi:multidrug transporter EmrE-like cation transporter